MSKKIMWGLAAAAAVVLGVFTLKGFPPVDGTQGTIGAAKRYDAEQMTDKDVTLGDTSTQNFLQSDTFAAIIQDPNTVKLLSDPGVSKALKDSGSSIRLDTMSGYLSRNRKTRFHKIKKGSWRPMGRRPAA